jgi:phosphopentomutase
LFLVDEFCVLGGLRGNLANRHASGTEIIAELGEEHVRTGKPICYTSADSVFQIAAHEHAFGLERLFELCRVAKPLTERYNIARVIARPFVGSCSADFRRTSNRRDYMTPPPAPTLLDRACGEGRHVITLGKIGDIFAGSGAGEVVTAPGNDKLFDRLLDCSAALSGGGLLMANFIDFDSAYGHRRDTAGYAAALEAFDRRLPDFIARREDDDLVVITADHGCDPTWHGTDHTREQVPVLVRQRGVSRCIGRLDSYADVGSSVAAHLSLSGKLAGRSFLETSNARTKERKRETGESLAGPP